MAEVWSLSERKSKVADVFLSNVGGSCYDLAVVSGGFVLEFFGMRLILALLKQLMGLIFHVQC